MSYSKCHSDTDNAATCMERTGQDTEVGAETRQAGLTPWRDKSACLDGQFLSLQTMAAGVQGDIPPLQFSDSIQSGNRHMGNRAFLRWVGEIHGDRQDVNIRGVPVQGLQHPALPRTHPAPLQLMPKKHKKKVPAAEEPPMALPQATPEASEESVLELVAALPRAQSGGAAVPAGKKKKKSRVQVALNTLRAGEEVEKGVEAFKRYIEAAIDEAELLHTLTERITRAQDLGDRQQPALEAVKSRLRALDSMAVADMPQAVAPGPGMFAEKPLMAPVRTLLNIREEELVDCCFKGNAVKFKQLLRFGNVDVNLAIKNGTLLFTAALRGHVAIVRELLSKPGIDVNLAQKSGGTPLFAAAQKGHVEVVRLLMEAPGIKFNLGTYHGGTTPLVVAAFKGLKDVVEILLTARNININVRQHDGATPLFTATQGNCHEIVELLVRRGASVNLGLLDDTTPLSLAAFKGNIEVVKQLLQASDIRVNQRTKEDTSALFYASQQGHIEVVELLLNKGADPEVADQNGLAPLHIACLLGRTDVIRALLNAGADMENTLDKEYTPYRLARIGGHREIIHLIEGRRRDKKGQALEDHVSPPIVPPASLPQADAVTAVQPEEITSTAEVSRDSGVTGDMGPASTAQATAAFADSSESVSASRTRVTETQSPLAQAKKEFRQDILTRLTNDRLDPLSGIRFLEDTNAADSIDTLRRLYNRLASIERQKERARRSKEARRSIPAQGAQVKPLGAAPRFALGERVNLDAEAVEGDIKQHLEQTYHRFVSQAVNDMEFDRGKPTAGYPGLLHASAGIVGVGSCSVFFYTEAEQNLIRIVGIGYHLDRGSYRLNYAVEELGGSGRLLRIS